MDVFFTWKSLLRPPYSGNNLFQKIPHSKNLLLCQQLLCFHSLFKQGNWKTFLLITHLLRFSSRVYLDHKINPLLMYLMPQPFFSLQHKMKKINHQVNLVNKSPTQVMATLQINKMGWGGKYLGLPEQFGRKKKEMFQYIKEAVQQKINGWQTKFLTSAGKETLIKAVAYAMPVYSINVFQLPIELCSELNSMIVRYWWGTTPEKRKLSWVSWKKMSSPKKEGGLGFRDLHQFNQALLANQVWKIMHRPNNLLFRLLKSRYFRSTNILSTLKGYQPSYRWNSLRFGCELLKLGTQTSIGDGKKTQIGVDPWLPTIPPRAPLVLPMINHESLVSTLMDTTTAQWNEQLISEYIHPSDQHLIRKIYIPHRPTADSHIWSYKSDGRYSVKSGYWLAKTHAEDPNEPKPPLAANPDIAAGIWRLNIAPKLKHFLWRVSSKATGVAENLRRRNMTVNPYCKWCCTESETSDHVLFSSPRVVAVWRSTGIPIHHLCDPTVPLEEN